MLPETSTIELRDGVVYWQNEAFNLSRREAQALADKVREVMATPGVDAILVDNEEASGTWPQVADDIWSELMADTYEAGLKSAIISPSATNAMHINRLSQNNGTYDQIKAFTADKRKAAEEFVGIASPEP